MPIVTRKADRKLIAALLIPSWLQLQSNPVGSLDSIKSMMTDLEKLVK